MTMTIEEKAKRYDKALERMKSWVRGEHPECFTEAQKAAEFIFPELKESEDEQSRKWILEYLYDGLRRSDEQFKGQFKCAIAWLEKQGEQKPQGKSALEVIKEENVDNQKCEKPTAWSEEDEQITLSIEQAMNCASLLNVVPEKIDKIKTWLKSLKDRCTWKPSSLQMECLHDAINHYHTNGYPASKLNELYEQMSKIYKL